MRTSRRGPTSEKRPRQGQPKTAPARSLPARAVPPHDDLDAAVAAAYGWLADPTDQEILERIVALNAARAAEEAKSKIRWLRPEFQNPSAPVSPSASAKLPAPRPLLPARGPSPSGPRSAPLRSRPSPPPSAPPRGRRPPPNSPPLSRAEKRRPSPKSSKPSSSSAAPTPATNEAPTPRPKAAASGRAGPPGAPRRSGGFRFPQVSAAVPAGPPCRKACFESERHEEHGRDGRGYTAPQPSARFCASASIRAFTRSSSAFTAAFTAGSSAELFTGALAKT